MKRLYLPVKHRGISLHIWCFKCKKPVTAKPCKHGKQQRFQSRVYNPLTQTANCIRSYETRDVEEALMLHQAYLTDLKASNYNVPIQSIKSEQTSSTNLIFLKGAAARYSDFLQDIGVPDQEKKNLSPAYIRDSTRYLMRFLECVQKVVGKITNYPVTAIETDHVSEFHKFLKAEDYSQTAYNSHMKAVKYFFDYVIKELKVVMSNPIEKVKMPEVHYDPEIIPVEEFEQLLSVITPENAIGPKGKKVVENINNYRPWLKKVFVLALLTGERLESIVQLRWSHIEGNFFKIPNFKVNRIKKEQSYYSYTPITIDLAQLLLEFDSTTDPEGYIVEPGMANRTTLKQFISKAFTHFWKVSGLKRKVSFKTLRKTYITRLTAVIGEKALFVKHNDDKTATKHYLKMQELLKQTKDTRLYDTANWLS
jgi:integrase